MAYLSNEAKKIYEIILDYGPVRPSEVALKAGISNKNLHKHLVRLLDQGLVEKSGSAPMVFYQKKERDRFGLAETVDYGDELIDKNYIFVSPSGEIIRGIKGFRYWCDKNNFNYSSEKSKFVTRLRSVQKVKRQGLISAKNIILSGKYLLFLSNIFFSDFYNLDHFGKTKLGQLVYVGKSSQNKGLISEVVELIKPDVDELIKRYDIKFVCFVPPTIARKVQFMDILKKQLDLPLGEVKIAKARTLTLIPQKSIRKLEDRMQNAQRTIAINPNQSITGNVIIIDDATGSGATMNEIAKKLKKIVPKKVKIYGYSIIGSYKGFDVISEV